MGMLAVGMPSYVESFSRRSACGPFCRQPLTRSRGEDASESRRWGGRERRRTESGRKGNAVRGEER